MAKIGVIGLGSVGSSVIHGMSLFHECSGYDIEGTYELSDILNSDFIFVCVPTPSGIDGRLDCSAIDSVLDTLSYHAYKGIVVIKSTVKVRYMGEAESRHPDLKLVYMPEFLRERSRFTWFLNPDRLVLSGKDAHVEMVLKLFSWVQNARIIRTDHISAEIGKLAHNAFIATKVSFTNEIEMISDEYKADSESVMEIVTSDRRVNSREHLRPGLGPYGGKCVPKDTAELINGATNPSLLRAVQTIHELFQDSKESHTDPDLLVIIPTKDRPAKLERALRSIMAQVRRPEKVIVVSDCSEKEESRSREIVDNLGSEIKIELIRNTHRENVSGAINTGIEYFLSLGNRSDNTFLAILDDDDWWERMYLSNVSDFAREFNSDWVVSGIIRHDGKNGQKIKQSIPKQISVGDFLVGNPNIQGSNLFVRLSKIIQTGMFDEELPSTTDRDICIRLLGLPDLKYDFLRNYLVHHDASVEYPRLSTPSSTAKKVGLEVFYKKYQKIMSEDQKSQFRERALNLFGIHID